MFIKNKNQKLLLVANIFLVFFLILLSNLQILPLQFGDFIFFAILVLALALYRPGWAFLFFVGTIMLENVNLAPAELGMAVRPYQFFGGLTILAIAIRFATGRLNFELIKLARYDFFIIALGAASFLSILGAPAKGVSFKLSIIIISYGFLYFLTRNFIQTKEDVKKIIPFFLSSSVVVILYGIWQNFRFMQNLSHFEVMPGRPNATFAEPDWLGIFLIMLLAVIYSIIYFLNKKNDEDGTIISNQILIVKSKILKISLYLLLTVIYTLLILTVSRSAWLGAFGVTLVFLLIFFAQLRMSAENWFAVAKKTLILKIKILAVFIISIAIVHVLGLTNFQLGGRMQSTGTGLQKITIACPGNMDGAVPKITSTENDYTRYGCRHINLEEINLEKSKHNGIYEIYRPDPNISVRSEIYKKSWGVIKQNILLGIGWGSINSYLGTDERGTGLNASNIFLEVWLGAGILGLLSFISIWIFIFIRAMKNLMQENLETKTLGVFMLLGIFAIFIPNLFNSGIMLGFLWLFLGGVFIDNKK